MNLFKTYASYCGVSENLPAPEFPTAYFQTPQKYITLHSSSGMPSKNYDFYGDALEIIADELRERQIAVVQIGGSQDEYINGCSDYRGVTTFRQCAHVVKHAMAHVGNDSVWAHVAGAFNIPLVELFGLTLAASVKPQWYNEDKSFFLEPDRGKQKPSYDPNEFPKTINNITPERVADAILESLGLPKKAQKTRQTVNIGLDYPVRTIEFIPDMQIDPGTSFPEGTILNARMDYSFNEKALQANLMFWPILVVTDQRINLKKIKHPNLKVIIYKFDSETVDIGFVDELAKSGITYNLVTSEVGSKFKDLKNDLFDYNPIISNPEDFKKRIKWAKKLKPNAKFKTHKFLLSNDGIFLSKWHWKNGASVQSFSQNTLPVPQVDSDDFWRDADYFYFFNGK